METTLDAELMANLLLGRVPPGLRDILVNRGVVAAACLTPKKKKQQLVLRDRMNAHSHNVLLTCFVETAAAGASDIPSCSVTEVVSMALRNETQPLNNAIDVERLVAPLAVFIKSADDDFFFCRALVDECRGRQSGIAFERMVAFRLAMVVRCLYALGYRKGVTLHDLFGRDVVFTDMSPRTFDVRDCQHINVLLSPMLNL